MGYRCSILFSVEVRLQITREYLLGLLLASPLLKPQQLLWHLQAPPQRKRGAPISIHMLRMQSP